MNAWSVIADEQVLNTQLYECQLKILAWLSISGTIFVESSEQKCQKELNIEKYCEMELCGINAMKIPYQHLELQVHRSHIEHQGWSWHLYLQVVMPTPNNAMHLLCFFY